MASGSIALESAEPSPAVVLATERLNQRRGDRLAVRIDDLAGNDLSRIFGQSPPRFERDLERLVLLRM